MLRKVTATQTATRRIGLWLRFRVNCASVVMLSDPSPRLHRDQSSLFTIKTLINWFFGPNSKFLATHLDLGQSRRSVMRQTAHAFSGVSIVK